MAHVSCWCYHKLPRLQIHVKLYDTVRETSIKQIQHCTSCLVFSLQVLVLCNRAAVMQQASPQLAVACLTACARNLESFSPDQLSLAVYLSAQSNLRLNTKCPDRVRQLVQVGIARAHAMSPKSLSHFMFGVAAVRGNKQSQLQVRSDPSPPNLLLH